MTLADYKKAFKHDILLVNKILRKRVDQNNEETTTASKSRKYNDDIQTLQTLKRDLCIVIRRIEVLIDKYEKATDIPPSVLTDLHIQIVMASGNRDLIMDKIKKGH